MADRGERKNGLVAAAMSATAVLTAGGIGNAATFANLQSWYAGLVKPGFTPPNWVFGPAWSVLYILMGVAFWRILVKPDATVGKGSAVVWFLVQMALNAAWSVAFFGLRSPLAGLVVIGLMIVAIIVTMVRFARVDRLAVWLMAPYLAWVCFASALNAGVWLLNRGA